MGLRLSAQGLHAFAHALSDHGGGNARATKTCFYSALDFYKILKNQYFSLVNSSGSPGTMLD